MFIIDKTVKNWYFENIKKSNVNAVLYGEQQVYLINDRLSKNATTIKYFVSFFLPTQNKKNLKNKIENGKLK